MGFPFQGGCHYPFRGSEIRCAPSVVCFISPPEGASLRTHPVGGRKGRHPSKDCFKGLKKPLKMGTAATRFPRYRPSRGVGCFLEAESGGCPLFPFPARGLKLITRSGTICSSRGKQPTGNPLFHSSSFSFAHLRPRGRKAPKPKASCFQLTTASARRTRRQQSRSRSWR